ncbi:cytochrome P450 [Phanerochaete sordida]|uniref:Cytochrome P450 n=1 Tax=Phanerochaete sordida TaxID=48140 RepID=A0A9P3GGF6_9APHY|nr:cytochrome P450 [Phanerochaete sordida]
MTRRILRNVFDRADPTTAIGVAAAACYLLYHRYLYRAPRPVVHLVLLLLVPVALVSLFARRLSVIQQCSHVLIYWTIVAALTVLYRISPLHPLARYPGPLAAKLSKFYLANLIVKGRAHENIRALHRDYGDVVRIGPNELSFNRSDAIPTIYAEKTMPKGPYYITRQSLDGVVQIDGVSDFKEHARRSKPWAKAMNGTAIKTYQPIVSSTVAELIEQLDKRVGGEVNMSDWMNFYGFDLMGRVVFGREWGMLREARDVGDYCHTIDKCVIMLAWLSQVPWIYPIMQLLSPPAEVNKMKEMGDNSCIARIDSGGSGTKDLYYYLMNEDGSSKSQLTRKEGLSDGVVAIIAGSDTAATALTHLCYYFLQRPECLRRLRHEIEEVYPSLGDELEDLARQADMLYLNACLNETLRLLPPVLTGLQRSVEDGTGGAMIAGYFVPEGTEVSVHHYSVQRNPKEFSPLPDTFWPDRWLEQDTYVLPTGGAIDRAQVHTNRNAFMPFSVGLQQCAGKNLALLELRAVACALFRRFDMTPSEKSNLENYERGLMDVYVTVKGPLYVHLTARQL